MKFRAMLFAAMLLSVSLCICMSAPTVSREMAILPESSGFPAGQSLRIFGSWAVARQVQPTGSETMATYAYNLVTGDMRMVSEDTKLINLSVGENYIAWEGMNLPPGDGDERAAITTTKKPPLLIVALNLKTWRAQFIADGSYPIPFGDDIAYIRSGKHIVLHNLKTHAERVIVNTSGSKHDLEVGGDLAVWVEWVNGSRQIRAAVISTGQEIAVTNQPGAHFLDPRTDGRFVVWEESGVKVYDTKSRKTLTIPGARRPDVSGGIVVYLKRDSAGKSAVFGKDLAKHEEFRISKEQSFAFPMIDGKRVAWTRDNRTNAVYHTEIVRQ